MTVSVIGLLRAAQSIFFLLLMVRMFASFMPNVSPSHPIMRFVYNTTEPILAPFRAILPTNNIGLDFSPLLALISINLVVDLLTRALY